MKTKTRLLAAGIAALLMNSSAMAAPLVWTLTDVVFEDDTTASGSFTFDADTSTYSDYAISTGSFFLYPGYDYNPDSADVTEDSNANQLGLDSNFGLPAFAERSVIGDDPDFPEFPIFFGPSLGLSFASALTNAGGTVGVTGNEFLGFFPFARFDGPSLSRRIVSGSVTATTMSAVPEPAAWAMMIGGFGMIGGAMRYRRGKRSVAFA